MNIPVLFKTQEDPSLEIAKGTGEMVALNVGDGSVKWKRDLAQPAYGAATISNDLVFTTTFEGKLIALDRDTGSVVWEKQMPAGTNATVARRPRAGRRQPSPAGSTVSRSSSRTAGAATRWAQPAPVARSGRTSTS